MNTLLELGAIDWNKSAALAAWFSNILIFTPLLICFIVKICNYISHWVVNESTTGLTLAIHNKTQSSLFILHVKLVIHGKPTKDIDPSSFRCIKPDEFIRIPIDYTKHDIKSNDHVSLHIHFAGKGSAKKIKVK